MGELMQRGSDLLLLSGDLMWLLAELLSETLLACEIEAVVARSDLALAEARVSQTEVAELLADPLMRAIATHHSGRSENGGRQGLSEEWCVVSVRH